MISSIICAIHDVHREEPVYLLAGECGLAQEECLERHNTSEWVGGEYLCLNSPTGESICGHCTHDNDDEMTYWPCPTIEALDDAKTGLFR